MKKYLDAFPATLLLIFTALVIAKPQLESLVVGLCVSAVLFGYQQFLIRTEQPDILAELQKLRQETDARVMNIQSKAEAELTQLRDDVAKFSLSMARVPGVVEKPKDRPKVQF